MTNKTDKINLHYGTLEACMLHGYHSCFRKERQMYISDHLVMYIEIATLTLAGTSFSYFIVLIIFRVQETALSPTTMFCYFSNNYVPILSATWNINHRAIL